MKQIGESLYCSRKFLLITRIILVQNISCFVLVNVLVGTGWCDIDTNTPPVPTSQTLQFLLRERELFAPGLVVDTLL